MLKWSTLLFGILLIVEKVAFVRQHPDHKITVALSERKPFVILNQNEVPKGLEILLIEKFARKLNLKIDYFLVNISLNIIFINESQFNSVPDQISLRNIDIMIGALNMNDLINKHYIASRPYHHDALTWCVQKQKPIPRWMSFFLMCTDPILLTTAPLLLIAVVGVMYFMEKFEDKQPKWDINRMTLHALLCVLGFAPYYKPKITAIRIFYGPSLYRFVLEHLKRQNETYPSELLEKFIIADDSNLDLYLNQLNENSKLAVAISREHARNILRNMHYKLYCFEDSEFIHDYELKFIMRKEFPHLNELNAFIKTASASGLIEKWRLNSQIKTKYKQEYEEEVRGIIIWEDCYGPLSVWWSMIMFVILIFCFEFLVYKKKRTLNSSRFWIHAEMAIDPERHFMLETIRFEHTQANVRGN